MTSQNKNDATYEKITDKLIDLLESGTVPWHQPWKGQRNVWGREYRGINRMILNAIATARGYESSVWITYNQAKKEGGQVQRGEKGTAVILWKVCKGKEKKNKTTGKKERGSFILARSFTVFNLDQIVFEDDDEENSKRQKLDKQNNTVADDAETQAMVDRYLEDKGPSLDHGGGRAYYKPSDDAIQMPHAKTFDDSDAYYATLFHEMGHSTGHSSRLAREGIASPSYFGGHEYSKEELVAEFCSAYLCGVTGRDNSGIADQSAAYLASWLKALKGDRAFLVTAAQRAQKAADLILGTTFEKEDQD